MSTGPCEAAPIVRGCQFKKMDVVRPIVPKGLNKKDIYTDLQTTIIGLMGTSPLL